MPDRPVYSLTPRQLQAMQVIQELTDASGGTPPTYLQIAAELELASKSGVNRPVNGLHGRGYLSRLPNQGRSLTILRRVPMPDFTPFTWVPAPGLRGQGEVANG